MACSPQRFPTPTKPCTYFINLSFPSLIISVIRMLVRRQDLTPCERLHGNPRPQNLVFLIFLDPQIHTLSTTDQMGQNLGKQNELKQHIQNRSIEFSQHCKKLSTWHLQQTVNHEQDDKVLTWLFASSAITAGTGFTTNFPSIQPLRARYDFPTENCNMIDSL